MISDELRRALLERDNYQCLYCGREDFLEPAHYKARSLTGPDELGNLLLLCFECHRKSHDGKLEIIKIRDKFFFKEKR
jgi:5-methylcytosine-specific restriction endonuclease McrA